MEVIAELQAMLRPGEIDAKLDSWKRKGGRRDLTRESNAAAAERLRLLQLEDENRLRAQSPKSQQPLQSPTLIRSSSKGGKIPSRSLQPSPSKRGVVVKQSSAPRTAADAGAFNRILNEINTLLWQADRLEQAHGLLIPSSWTQGRFVDAKYDYYAFEYVDRVPLSIQINCTEGPCDVFADVGNLYPGFDRFMWHAQLASPSETLLVDLEREPEATAQSGWLFVSARPSGRSAGPYGIRVSCKQHRKLAQGIPAQGRVNGQGFVHGKYQVPAGHNHVQVQLTLVRGMADLVASTTDEFPTRAKPQYRGNRLSDDLVMIEFEDGNLKANDFVYVGVGGCDEEARYALRVTSERREKRARRPRRTSDSDRSPPPAKAEAPAPGEGSAGASPRAADGAGGLRKTLSASSALSPAGAEGGPEPGPDAPLPAFAKLRWHVPSRPGRARQRPPSREAAEGSGEGEGGDGDEGRGLERADRARRLARRYGRSGGGQGASPREASPGPPCGRSPSPPPEGLPSPQAASPGPGGGEAPAPPPPERYPAAFEGPGRGRLPGVVLPLDAGPGAWEEPAEADPAAALIRALAASGSLPSLSSSPLWPPHVAPVYRVRPIALGAQPRPAAAGVLEDAAGRHPVVLLRASTPQNMIANYASLDGEAGLPLEWRAQWAQLGAADGPAPSSPPDSPPDPAAGPPPPPVEAAATPPRRGLQRLRGVPTETPPEEEPQPQRSPLPPPMMAVLEDRRGGRGRRVFRPWYASDGLKKREPQPETPPDMGPRVVLSRQVGNQTVTRAQTAAALRRARLPGANPALSASLPSLPRAGELLEGPLVGPQANAWRPGPAGHR